MAPSGIATKIKVQLKLAIARLRLVQKQDEAQSRTQRRTMAQLLEAGKVDSARIRVENIIRIDIVTELHEILELYCELLLARAGLLDGPTCDLGLEEAVKSIIYAAPKTEIKELSMVRSMLGEKYGKQFVLDAMENVDGKVSEKVVKKLSVTPPKEELVRGYLEEIAKAYRVNWPRRDLGEVSPDFLDKDINDPSKGQAQMSLEAPLPAGSSEDSKHAKAQEDLSRTTLPKIMGDSPLRVVPSSPSTDNLRPRVTLNRMELTPSKNMQDAPATPKPASKQEDLSSGIAGVDELARRFAALKK